MRNWVLVLTRRAKRRLTRHLFAQRFFDSIAGQRIRHFIYRTDVERLREVVDALDGSGVRWWLAGGWGVDALVGRQTRSHVDADVCIDAVDRGEARVHRALAPLGYEVTDLRALSGGAFPVRSILRDQSGRTLDLLLVYTDDADPGEHRDEGNTLPTLGPDSFDRGTVAGRDVPCISAALQLRAHSGYAPQPKDVADVQALCEQTQLAMPALYERVTASPGSKPPLLRRVATETITRLRGSSALLVFVPEADHILNMVISGHHIRLPAHMTVLYPFIPPRRIQDETIQELRRIAEAVPSSDVELAGTATFGTNAYLTVEPGDPFEALTRACWNRWPAYPPYGGAYDDIVPHVLISDKVLPQDIASTVTPHLPIRCKPHEMTLITYGLSGRWQAKKTFPFAAPDGVADTLPTG